MRRLQGLNKAQAGPFTAQAGSSCSQLAAHYKQQQPSSAANQQKLHLIEIGLQQQTSPGWQ